MKNQNRVRRKAGSKSASAQARSQSTAQAAKGLKTYRVFTVAAGETDMTKWQECESIQARSPLSAARQQLGQFKRLAVCRFNQGAWDYIFERDTSKDPDDHTAGTITFTNHVSGRPVVFNGLSASLVEALERAAERDGMNLNGFIDLALREAIQPDEPVAITPVELDTLEACLRKIEAMNLAFLTLLEQGDTPSDAIVAGLSLLAASPCRELGALNEKLRQARRAYCVASESAEERRAA